METITNIALLGATVINTTIALALLYGLKTQVNDPKCKDEVKSVKRNKIFLKTGIITASVLNLFTLISHAI